MNTEQAAQDARPDPSTGRQAGAAYAEFYIQGHLKTSADDLDYRLLYGDLLFVDQIRNNYTRLEVGCGTGGYLRLLKRHRHVTAIDFSQATIEAAQQHQASLGIERVTFQTDRFETFAGGKFDVVSVRGVYGNYQPWPISRDILPKVHRHLNPGGLFIASFVPPQSPFQIAKAVIFPKRTIVIRPARFYNMMRQAGFTPLCRLDLPNLTVAVLRAN